MGKRLSVGSTVQRTMPRGSYSMQPSLLGTDRERALTVDNKAPMTVVKMSALAYMVMKVTVRQKAVNLLTCSSTIG